MTNTSTKIIIAHRGNLDGPNSDKENHPDYIKEALKQGFDVEIDLWSIDNKLYLGHDGPQYETNWDFIQDHMWVHCKNIEAFKTIIGGLSFIHCFFHDTDDCTLTSEHWIWTYPGKPILCEWQVAVMPERVPDWDISKAGGICTDYPGKYKVL